MAEKPGVMLYFDILEPLEDLSDDDVGKLFRAIMEYGKFGVIPEFKGGLKIAWKFIKPKLDRDDCNYNRTIDQRRYANFCSRCKENGVKKPTYDEWLCATEHDRTRMLLGEYEGAPTTTVTPTENISQSLSSPGIKPNPKTTAGAGKGEGVGEKKTDPNDFNAMRNAAFEKLRNYSG